ncbi:MAG: hypothetical protein RLZZ488_44 [Pseudomonadota bacterium]
MSEHLPASAVRQINKLYNTKVLNRALFLLPAALLLGGCGFLDVYKKQEKRCKAFCDADSTKPEEDPPFNFDIGYWNQTTPRSQLDPNTELVPLLRSNPMKLLANALKTVSEDLGEAKQAIGKTPATTQTECLKEVFTSPFKNTEGRSEGSLDYGRCVDLRKLEERLNSSRNSSTDGKIKVIELDSALHLISLGRLPLAAGGDAMQDAGSGLDLANVLPFRSVKAADVASPNETQNLKFLLVRGSVQGTALEKAGTAGILKKSWGLLYAGLDENQPLQVDWQPAQNNVKISGSMATLSAAFQRATTQTQWDGFGYSREFIFANFSFSAPQLELNSQLGWSDQAVMNGSYYLRINGDLVEAGGQQSKLFHMKASGRACMLDVGLVTGFQGETPVEQSLGQISICTATN